MTDTLVHHDDGQEVWHASHTLRPIDGYGDLSDRQEAQQAAEIYTLATLREIRRSHVANWRQPWPGCEFAKALLGRAIDAAIEEKEKSSEGIRR